MASQVALGIRLASWEPVARGPFLLGGSSFEGNGAGVRRFVEFLVGSLSPISHRVWLDLHWPGFDDIIFVDLRGFVRAVRLSRRVLSDDTRRFVLARLFEFRCPPPPQSKAHVDIEVQS